MIVPNHSRYKFMTIFIGSKGNISHVEKRLQWIAKIRRIRYYVRGLRISNPEKPLLRPFRKLAKHSDMGYSLPLPKDRSGRSEFLQYSNNSWGYIKSHICKAIHTCKDYFSKILSDENSSRVFLQPDWMPSISLPFTPPLQFPPLLSRYIQGSQVYEGK